MKHNGVFLGAQGFFIADAPTCKQNVPLFLKKKNKKLLMNLELRESKQGLEVKYEK